MRGLAFPRDDHGAASVDSSYPDLTIDSLEKHFNVRAGQRDREHGALMTNQPGPGTAAIGDDRDGLLQGQSACEPRGRHLALGMTNHRGGLETRFTPQESEASHHREQHRLGRGFLPPIHAIVTGQQVADGPVKVVSESSVAGVDVGGEQRRLGQQPRPHPGPLGSLSREHEGHPAAGFGAAAQHLGSLAVPRTLASEDREPTFGVEPRQQGRAFS